MKKILSSFIVFAMLLSICVMPTMAASSNTLTYHLTSDNKYERTVPAGTIVTVSFAFENDNDEPITLKRLQNEIYYDHSFFEYVADSFKAETSNAGISGGLQVYSTDEHRVYTNSNETVEYPSKAVVSSFQLKVIETTVGASSIIETKAQKATDTIGEITTINEKNLKIIIGDASAKAEYTITYVDGDKTLDTVKVLDGDSVRLKAAPEEKEGYNFKGWRIGEDVKEAGSDYTVTGNVTATAQWETKQKYTLTFNTNGGSSVSSITDYAGTKITLTQTTSKSGYTFNGWYTESTLTNKVTEITLNADTTIYAKFTKDSSNGPGGGGGGGGGGGSTPTTPTPTPTTPNDTDDVTNGGTSHHPSTLITEHVAYIVGRDEGMIAPNENITRAEVATIFFRLLTEDVRNESYTKENIFDDSNADDWFNTAVSTLANLKIVYGRTYNGFEPNAFITRAEFTTIAARFSDAVYNGEDLFTDISEHWAREYINAAASIGWIVGNNGIFRPDDNITRAEVMTLVNRMLERQPESKDDLLDGMTVWADNPESEWYYLAVQEATNSHDYKMKADKVHEKWTKLTENPDWGSLEQ